MQAYDVTIKYRRGKRRTITERVFDIPWLNQFLFWFETEKPDNILDVEIRDINDSLVPRKELAGE